MTSFFQGLGRGFAHGMNNMFWGGIPCGGYIPRSYISWSFGMPAFGSPMMNLGCCYSFQSVFMSMPMMMPMSPMSFINTGTFMAGVYCGDTFRRSLMNQSTSGSSSSSSSSSSSTTSSRTETTSQTVTNPESATETQPADKNNTPITVSDKANELYAKWSAKKDKSENSALTPEFCEKVIEISGRVKCEPDDLLALMYAESRFNPKAENKTNKSKNVGLIQFGAATRTDLNISYDKLYRMSGMEQLDYVEKFIAKVRKDQGYKENETLSLGTLAALTFRPAYSRMEELATEEDTAYKNNPELDTDGNGVITKTELADRLRSYQ